MSKADEIRKTAQATRERTRAAKAQPVTSEVEAPPPATRRPTVRTRRVRKTVDLTTNTHRDLSRWSEQAARTLDVTRVTSQEVLSALVDELLADQALQQAVSERIRRGRA